MQLLIFIIAYPLLRIVSIIPFKGLYFLSDVLYIIIYSVIGYRRAVVRANLKLAFPEKKAEELKNIERDFYRHMCDVFLEMIKTFSISEAEMQKRFSFTNIDILQKVEQKKHVILMFPHYASWEWVIALNKHIKLKGYAVYKRIANVHFDRLIRAIRKKFGTTLIETKETPAVILRNKRKNIPSMYGFLSDQSPLKSKAIYWSNFMDVKVPVHTGAEVLAKRLKLAVVYLSVQKVKRGHYSASFKILSEDASATNDFEITEKFLRETEQQIRTEPAYYLWTHKRWKHKDHVPEAFQ